MKKRNPVFVLPLALLFASGLAFAKGDQKQNVQKPAEQASQSQSMSGSESKSQDQQQSAVQQSVAPHSIFVNASLKSAKDELSGLRTQVKVAENQPAVTSDTQQHFKKYQKAIKQNVSKAETHQSELKGALQKFPTIAKNDTYQTYEQSFNSFKTESNNVLSKMNDKAYWNNLAQVRSDLDRLDKALNDTLDKNQKFSSDQLNVSFVG